VDSRTHQEITAATAVHRELGPDYQDAVAESLVERIGAEVDRRVDARLAQRGVPAPAPAPQPSPAQVATAGRSGWPAVVLALGSMLFGVIASAVLASGDRMQGASPGVAVAIWAVIAVINIAFARRR
jgi:hypothetical protein